MKDKKIFTKKLNRHKTVILCLFSIYISAHIWAQKNTQNTTPIAQNTQQNKTTKSAPKLIVLKQADTMEKRLGSEDQILINNVILFHDGALMYCDSAYLNEAQNTFKAFGTVKIEQGDTLFMYCSYLDYDGNTQLLKARKNVRLENKDITLFTDSLDYDRLYNIGYYFEGGMLVDSVNELTSYWGQYEPSKNRSLFSDSVRLTNPNFTIFTDTLTYNTKSKIADILGYTRIISDSATIYTTKGWYNTNTEESLLLDGSTIVNKEGFRTLTGDSISYHKKDGYGEVFGNMLLQDTIQKIILKGNYGLYNELTNYAMATDSALAISYSEPDTLYLHADTLQLTTDSTFRQINAHYGVRFYRTDLQGVCDSLQFNNIDSILHLYKNPVLWNENNQIFGDTIDIHFNDSTIEMAHIKKFAFSIEQKDSIHYNQLKGRDLKAFFDNKQVKRIMVEGNAESIFYPEEDNATMIGMNQTQSSYLSIDFKDKKIDKLKLWPKATGKMIPLSDLLPEQGKLPKFEWLDYLRPKDKDDVFRAVKRTTNDVNMNKIDRFSRTPKK